MEQVTRKANLCDTHLSQCLQTQTLNIWRDSASQTIQYSK